MNRTLFLVVMIACLVAPAFAQSQDVPKYEVAAEFTTFERDDITGRRTEPGIAAGLPTISTAFSLSKRRVISFRGDVFNAGTVAVSQRDMGELKLVKDVRA